MTENYNVLVLGQSGSGKSTAIRTLDPATTVIIATDDKPLPFRATAYKTVMTKNEEGKSTPDYKKSNYIKIPAFKDSPKATLAALEKVAQQPWVKVIVLDTFTTPLVNFFMNTLDTKGYDKFNHMGYYNYRIIEIMASYPKFFFINAHTEYITDGSGLRVEKIKNVGGKLGDEKVDFPTRMSVVLYARSKREKGKNKYVLETQSDGLSLAKTPLEMFEQQDIPNDYQYVLDCIEAYVAGKPQPALPGAVKK